MKTKLLGIAFLSVVTAGFSACGGNNDTSAKFSARCGDAGDFCVTGCNLGCTLQTCSLSDIAENQPLVFTFSQEVDPKSVTPQSLSIQTATGIPADGQYVIEGNKVTFVPSLRNLNGLAVFGFRKNQQYVLRLDGGEGSRSTIRSLSGSELGHRLECSLNAKLGIIDLDAKEPVSTITVPTAIKDVAQDTLVVLEFSELLNPGQFINGGAGNGITYSVISPNAKGECVATRQPMPGTVSHVMDTVGNRSTVIFRPSVQIPSNACFFVNVTDQCIDLSGKGAIPAEYTFRVRQGSQSDQSIEEKFLTTSQFDTTMSGATWGNGTLLPGKIGGTGIHGTFRADIGTFLKKENGISYYEWNTDLIKIPFVLTLHGEAYWKAKLGANKNEIEVTNGKLEFSEFELKDTEVIILRGKTYPEFRCIGDMKVDGQIILQLNNPVAGTFGGKGGPGTVGSLGGASGGQGGDAVGTPGGSINGRNGPGVVVPAGHPRESQAKDSGGIGSLANPTSGLVKDIKYFGTGGFACRMTAAGGGGASFFSPDGKTSLGTAGECRSLAPTAGPTFPPHNAEDIGTPSVAGKPFPVMPVSTGVSSRTLFLIGGAGGGGGGTSPCGSFPSSITWIPGVGGGAGGGIIHLLAGNIFSGGTKGKILAMGGAGAGKADSSSVNASGGGGSGGSILIQCGAIPSIFSELNVLGGVGGSAGESTWLEVGSYGGKGGAGMIRVESDPAPSHASFSGFQPAATDQNVGLLRSVDYDKITVGTSKWYNTKFLFAPLYTSYTIEAKINGQPVTYSDDGKHQEAVEGQPVVFLIQTTQLDLKTGQPRQDSTPTSWYEGTVNPLSLDKNNGNGFRFMIRTDMSVLSTTSIEILSVKVNYRG